MTKIYGNNAKRGYKNEKAAMEWLRSKGFKVNNANFINDVKDKCDLLARSPKGQEYAIQVKSVNYEMSVEDQHKLISWSKRHNKLPRMIIVRAGYRCNWKKLPEDKE